MQFTVYLEVAGEGEEHQWLATFCHVMPGDGAQMDENSKAKKFSRRIRDDFWEETASKSVFKGEAIAAS